MCLENLRALFMYILILLQENHFLELSILSPSRVMGVWLSLHEGALNPLRACESPQWPSRVVTTFSYLPIPHCTQVFLCGQKNATEVTHTTVLLPVLGLKDIAATPAFIVLCETTCQIIIRGHMEMNWGLVPRALWVSHLRNGSSSHSPACRWVQLHPASWLQPHERCWAVNSSAKPLLDAWPQKLCTTNVCHF